MNRRSLGLLILVCVFFLAGCGRPVKLDDGEVDIYAKIHRKYMSMNSYTAKVSFTVRSNKTENVYQGAQAFKAPDQYRLELTAPEALRGMVSVVKGGEVMTDAGMGGAFAVDSAAQTAGDALYLDQFFSNYYRSEETAVSVTGGGEGKYTVLSTEVIDGSAANHSMALMVDNETLLPYRLTIYDMGGQERVVAEYSEVILNPQLDEKLFSLQ